MKKIVLAGGSGYLGSRIAEYFSTKDFEVVILSREQKENKTNIRTILWDAKSFGTWCNELEGAEVIINLTGESVDCRYNEKNKKLIYSSRLDSTNIIGEAIKRCTYAPKLWINASSATIYRSSFDKPMTEATGEIGNDFSMDVCKQWEAVFNQHKLTKTRKVILRTSIVLGNSGGAFVPYKILTRIGLGGVQGSGKQYSSWLHEKDFCRIVEWIIKTPDATGVYNTTAPFPITNQIFMNALRSVLNIPFGIPLPGWLLNIGAVLARTETELLLKSRWVLPERLLNEGFQFEFPKIEDAFADLVKS
jgi:uncharacterized protein